jgi:hypothetical protein
MEANDGREKSQRVPHDGDALIRRCSVETYCFRLVQFAELIVPGTCFCFKKNLHVIRLLTGGFRGRQREHSDDEVSDRHWTEDFRILALLLNLPCCFRPFRKRFFLTTTEAICHPPVRIVRVPAADASTFCTVSGCSQ